MSAPVASLTLHPVETDILKPYPAKSEDDAACWASFQHPEYVDAIKVAGLPCDEFNIEGIRMAMAEGARYLWSKGKPITVHALGLRLNRWVATQHQWQQVPQ